MLGEFQRFWTVLKRDQQFSHAFVGRRINAIILAQFNCLLDRHERVVVIATLQVKRSLHSPVSTMAHNDLRCSLKLSLGFLIPAQLKERISAIDDRQRIVSSQRKHTIGPGQSLIKIAQVSKSCSRVYREGRLLRRECGSAKDMFVSFGGAA